MTLLVARAAPVHAFVASDHRHALEANGRETMLVDLGPKLYPVAAGFGAAGCNGASGYLVAVQAARMTRDLDGADLGAVHRLLAGAYDEIAPEVPADVEGDRGSDENPANGVHVLALRRGGDGFGGVAVHADGEMIEQFTEGFFVAVSAGMTEDVGHREARERLHDAWDAGDEPATIAGDVARLERMLGTAAGIADDVAPRATLAGIDADGERFVRRIEAAP